MTLTLFTIPSLVILSGKRITRQLELSKLTGHHHDDGTGAVGKGTHTFYTPYSHTHALACSLYRPLPRSAL